MLEVAGLTLRHTGVVHSLGVANVFFIHSLGGAVLCFFRGTVVCPCCNRRYQMDRKNEKQREAWTCSCKKHSYNERRNKRHRYDAT